MKPREEETLAEAPRLILDIGTHKVLGLAAVPAGSGVRVLASALARHPDRSMRDGQVHDVKAVAKAIRQVVRELEQPTGPRRAAPCAPRRAGRRPPTRIR